MHYLVFFLQLLHSLRDRLLHVTSQFSGYSRGDAATATTVNNPAMGNLVTGLSASRGIARAVGSLAAQSDSVTDLVSYVWTGLLLPVLNSGANVLILVITLVHLFFELLFFAS